VPPTDICDRAILMLFSVYGFRSSEVAALRLDDLDWEKELLHIYRPKQRKRQTYPFAHSVGESILCYLKNVRPCTSRRELFLLRRAPFTPLSNSTLYAIASRRLRSLNIETNHYGAHSIRHACATRLLEQAHSLKEIGDYLGHKDPETTRIYAKVDINGLRQVGDVDLEDIL
jgi:integrase/recombinase XerD